MSPRGTPAPAPRARASASGASRQREGGVGADLWEGGVVLLEVGEVVGGGVEGAERGGKA